MTTKSCPTWLSKDYKASGERPRGHTRIEIQNKRHNKPTATYPCAQYGLSPWWGTHCPCLGSSAWPSRNSRLPCKSKEKDRIMHAHTWAIRVGMGQDTLGSELHEYTLHHEHDIRRKAAWSKSHHRATVPLISITCQLAKWIHSKQEEGKQPKSHTWHGQQGTWEPQQFYKANNRHSPSQRNSSPTWGLHEHQQPWWPLQWCHHEHPRQQKSAGRNTEKTDIFHTQKKAIKRSWDIRRKAAW